MGQVYGELFTRATFFFQILLLCFDPEPKRPGPMNLIEDITQAQHSAQFAVRHIVEAHSRATQSDQTAVEEVGEAQKEALEHHWEGKHYGSDPERLGRLRSELVQVAAVAVAAVESLDRNELQP